jgi:cytochrome c-type biogenesis protein CcmH/NrfG
MTPELFNEINKIYGMVLEMDPFDIEANFNLGLLYLQNGQDVEMALGCFETVVTKDDGQATSEFF